MEYLRYVAGEREKEKGREEETNREKNMKYTTKEIELKIMHIDMALTTKTATVT